jgi:hypothetical protein
MRCVGKFLSFRNTTNNSIFLTSQQLSHVSYSYILNPFTLSPPSPGTSLKILQLEMAISPHHVRVPAEKKGAQEIAGWQQPAA